jgi:hypothetical protein
MIDMILDHCAFGATNRALDCVELLGDLSTGSVCLNHVDDAAQVPTGAGKAFDDGWVAGVDMIAHIASSHH